ncbi:MAG TPA: alpha/beta fold hydrolase [Pseudolabrys sp.]|uniref:alpha/beta fold hydrolase n=1 Tax=Pseudolabrys sp. TaxID=1960880 RepID=UPI002DDD17EE|nr:alpha/beta fold hydrolase [Pseudolabrys sp.]HEV2630996.1 alpha/beta fold hydrolase [Pseudolabrys sp.]
MPYATTSDNVKLYFEEVGQGTAILFVHEFASDWRGWEPQLREFGKRHRCITYSARGYTPSDVPADAGAYTYEHVMRDAVAVLDHLKIDKAHLIGLSMGGYTSLQVALNHPERVHSMVLAGTGSGSERWYTADFHKHSQALGDTFERDGAAAVAKTYGMGASRVPFLLKDPRGFAEFTQRLAEHDAKGSANTSRGFQGGRPSLYDFEGRIRRLETPALIVVGDEDDRCIEPSLFLKQTLPAAGLVMFPKSGHVVNLEEPDLFNSVVGEFLARVEAGRWAVRDPRTKSAEGVIPMRG